MVLGKRKAVLFLHIRVEGSCNFVTQLHFMPSISVFVFTGSLKRCLL